MSTIAPASAPPEIDPREEAFMDLLATLTVARIKKQQAEAKSARAVKPSVQMAKSRTEKQLMAST